MGCLEKFPKFLSRKSQGVLLRLSHIHAATAAIAKKRSKINQVCMPMATILMIGNDVVDDLGD